MISIIKVPRVGGVKVVQDLLMLQHGEVPAPVPGEERVQALPLPHGAPQPRHERGERGEGEQQHGGGAEHGAGSRQPR